MAREYVISGNMRPGVAVSYGSALNAEQYRVVVAPAGPILVVAGPGSGKTRTVTYRVARLVESGVDPSRILLATFTNRAAREMLARVEALVRSNLRKVWGGTFHSIANRMLRKHAGTLGYRENFTILDTEDAKELIDLSLSQSGIDINERRFPRAEVLHEISSFACNRQIPVRSCVEQFYPQFEPLSKHIEYVLDGYAGRKLERNCMDYDDLLVNCRRLLAEQAEVAAFWRHRFEHILVDEYQDTNKIQGDIVDLLAAGHRNVMVSAMTRSRSSAFGARTSLTSMDSRTGTPMQ